MSDSPQHGPQTSSIQSLTADSLRCLVTARAGRITRSRIEHHYNDEKILFWGNNFNMPHECRQWKRNFVTIVTMTITDLGGIISGTIRRCLI